MRFIEVRLDFFLIMMKTPLFGVIHANWLGVALRNLDVTSLHVDEAQSAVPEGSTA